MTADNITWHPSRISPEEREALLKQKGCVVWLTGLSGSGKSTIACGVEQKLIEQGHLAYILDGDNVRHGLNHDLGFSDQDRTENIRRIGEVAKLFADCGVICIVSFISPFRAVRQQARDTVGPDRFLEVHVHADLATCEDRDPKGLYQKARAGEISDMTGIDSPYEPPEDPALMLDTAEATLEESVGSLLELLAERGVVGS